MSRGGKSSKGEAVSSVDRSIVRWHCSGRQNGLEGGGSRQPAVAANDVLAVPVADRRTCSGRYPCLPLHISSNNTNTNTNLYHYIIIYKHTLFTPKLQCLPATYLLHKNSKTQQLHHYFLYNINSITVSKFTSHDDLVGGGAHQEDMALHRAGRFVTLRAVATLSIMTSHDLVPGEGNSEVLVASCLDGVRRRLCSYQAHVSSIGSIPMLTIPPIPYRRAGLKSRQAFVCA